MNEPTTDSAAPVNDPGFLQLESMASMQRLGDGKDGAAFFEGGSTLLDLDGSSEKQARNAAAEHRADIAHGRHVSERYKVMGEIARGGMGAILEVRDADLDRSVAMKVLLRDTRKDKTGSGSPMDSGPVNRFIAEAQLTGSLEHPNIVPVHELGLDSQGRVYFTMKRVKGRSLRQVLDKLRQGHQPTLMEFTQGRMMSILLKICDALAFAHSRGIVHRDLKPENIMVGQFGEVLVMDWGLAKQVDSTKPAQALPENKTRVYQLDIGLGNPEADSGGTREGTISGTPAYMAPEQARGAVKEISQRTDVFCLGGILYEMLCLVPPFVAPTVSEALDNAREHRLLNPRDKLDTVLRSEKLKQAFGPKGILRGRKHPRELVSIALKAMNEKRELRYASVEELKHDIENFLSALPVSARRDSPWVALGKWSRRHPTRAAVTTLAIVFLLLGGIVAAVVQAKFADDRARLAEEKAEAEADAGRQVKLRLSAEEDARKQAERARIQAERAAKLEQDKLERERREAESLAARQAAFVPYSQAADLRTRSATFKDWGKRADAWRQCVGLYQRALQLDDKFVEAHLELASVYADLGFDDDALNHFARADALTAVQTGRGHVEALMAYAMYDFQAKVLREGLGATMDEVFRRFVPVRDAAEKDSSYARIAQVLIDLGESYRTATTIDFLRAMNDAAGKLSAVEGEGLPLWEVYTLLAIVDEGGKLSERMKRRSYLESARDLKPNLPLLRWLEIREIARGRPDSDKAGITAWDRFIEQFPYDPRGYFSRANLRFQSEKEHDPEKELADLDAAIARNPRYADAHKLKLRVYVRQPGQAGAAIKHLETMRKSQSGLDNEAIDLIEVELTAGTGDYARLQTLVLAALSESAPHGAATLAQAASVLLRDNEFAEVARLCDAVGARVGPAAPPLCALFKGRALTMLAQFDEALELLRPLEDNPGRIPDDYRDALRQWAEDARRYPEQINSFSLPSPRQRLDLGRIRAVAGAAPGLFIGWLSTANMRREDIQDYSTPADNVLLALGFARRAVENRVNADQDRSSAVQSLKQAFDEGYLNRKRILQDRVLEPLTRDSLLAKYFGDVR